MPDVPFEMGQTAVLVEIPEALPVVGSWRARFDTSAAVGVPPHVTILFPFLPLHTITSKDRAALRALAAGERAFTVSLGSFGVFTRDEPDVLYLAPEPDAPFRRLTAALTARWPLCPPYGGAVDDPIPHLTVTETAPDDQIAAARRAIAPRLPMTAPVLGVTMITFDGARWHREERFPLGT